MTVKSTRLSEFWRNHTWETGGHFQLRNISKRHLAYVYRIQFKISFMNFFLQYLWVDWFCFPFLMRKCLFCFNIEEMHCGIKQLFKQLHTSNVNNLVRSKWEVSYIRIYIKSSNIIIININAPVLIYLRYFQMALRRIFLCFTG